MNLHENIISTSECPSPPAKRIRKHSNDETSLCERDKYGFCKVFKKNENKELYEAYENDNPSNKLLDISKDLYELRGDIQCYKLPTDNEIKRNLEENVTSSIVNPVFKSRNNCESFSESTGICEPSTSELHESKDFHALSTFNLLERLREDFLEPSPNVLIEETDASKQPKSELFKKNSCESSASKLPKSINSRELYKSKDPIQLSLSISVENTDLRQSPESFDFRTLFTNKSVGSRDLCELSANKLLKSNDFHKSSTSNSIDRTNNFKPTPAQNIQEVQSQRYFSAQRVFSSFVSMSITFIQAYHHSVDENILKNITPIPEGYGIPCQEVSVKEVTDLTSIGSDTDLTTLSLLGSNNDLTVASSADEAAKLSENAQNNLLFYKSIKENNPFSCKKKNQRIKGYQH